MKRIVFLVFVVLLLLLIYFIITKSRFGAGLGGTAPSIDDKYKVEINFNYQNPASFGTSTANFKCILLYLERVGDLGETIPYDKNVQPSKTDIFSNKNIFYTEYYNAFNNQITKSRLYYKLFNVVTEPATGITVVDGIYITFTNPDDGTPYAPLYTRLNLINVINSGSDPDTVSAYYDMLNNYIYNYIPFCSTDPTITGAAGNFPILTIEVDTNDTIILCDNKKSNQPSEQVYLKTVSTDNYFKLYLSPGQYKFGVAIVNDQITIQTGDYNIFPYTISDFTFTDTLLQVNGNFAPSISASVTGLSAVIEYVKDTTAADTTPPVISNNSITDITYTTSKFNFTSNETGKVFTLAKISSEPAPSFDDILISGASNNISIGTNIILLSGLIPGNNYTLYSILQDTNTNYSINNNNKIFKNDFITPITSNSALTTLNDKLLNDIVVSPKDTDFRNIDGTTIQSRFQFIENYIIYNNKNVVVSGNNGRYNVYKDIVKYLNDINNYSQTGLYMPTLNNPPLPTLNNTEKKSALDKLNLDLKTLLIDSTVPKVYNMFPETTYNKEISIVTTQRAYVIYNGVFSYFGDDSLALRNLYKYIIDQINNTNGASIGSDLYINYLI